MRQRRKSMSIPLYIYELQRRNQLDIYCNCDRRNPSNHLGPTQFISLFEWFIRINDKSTTENRKRFKRHIVF